MVLIKNAKELNKLSEHSFFSGKKFDNSQTSVFVCKNFTCSLPLTELSDIEKQL